MVGSLGTTFRHCSLLARIAGVLVAEIPDGLAQLGVVPVSLHVPFAPRATQSGKLAANRFWLINDRYCVTPDSAAARLRVMVFCDALTLLSFIDRPIIVNPINMMTNPKPVAITSEKPSSVDLCLRIVFRFFILFKKLPGLSC